MAAIVWADVVAVAPELAELSSALYTDILGYVNVALVPTEWGGEDSSRLRLARLYLAAHYATMVSRGGSVGEIVGFVTSESAGGLSRSYSSGASTGTVYDATPYGQLFWALFRSTLVTLPIVL